MAHTKNKVDWCLKKAQEELKQGKVHRGLVITKRNVYKLLTINNPRMFPSDPSGLLDDFIFLNYFFSGGLLWKRH